MGYVTAVDHRRRVIHRTVGGSNRKYMGDGFFDWIKGAISKVLPILRPILAPVLGIAKQTLLPAAIGALESGSTAGLKQAAIQTFKQAAPGILERGTQAGLEQLQKVIPKEYGQYVQQPLKSIADSAVNMANDRIQQIQEGSGMTKKRKKKIDKLVSGSGLLKYA